MSVLFCLVREYSSVVHQEPVKPSLRGQLREKVDCHLCLLLEQSLWNQALEMVLKKFSTSFSPAELMYTNPFDELCSAMLHIVVLAFLNGLLHSLRLHHSYLLMRLMH